MCFDLTHVPVATAARAAATGLVSMSTRPDPEGSDTVEIATRRCPRLRVCVIGRTAGNWGPAIRAVLIEELFLHTFSSVFIHETQEAFPVFLEFNRGQNVGTLSIHIFGGNPPPRKTWKNKKKLRRNPPRGKSGNFGRK